MPTEAPGKWGITGKSEQSFIFARRYQIKEVPDQKDRVGHRGGREEEQGRRPGMDFPVQLLRKLLIIFYLQR